MSGSSYLSIGYSSLKLHSWNPRLQGFYKSLILKSSYPNQENCETKFKRALFCQPIDCIKCLQYIFQRVFLKKQIILQWSLQSMELFTTIFACHTKYLFILCSDHLTMITTKYGAFNHNFCLPYQAFIKKFGYLFILFWNQLS